MLHEGCLGVVYNDKRSPFRELLERDDSVTIHQRNIQILLTKIFLISKRIHMIWEREIACRGKLLYHVSLVVKTVSNIQSNSAISYQKVLEKLNIFMNWKIK